MSKRVWRYLETSPLQQIMDHCEIPHDEQTALVQYLIEANENINDSDTIRQIGTDLSTSFRETAGSAHAMSIALGLGEPSFADITRGLKVLLSGYGLQNLDPSRNGLGLNNILYVSMLLKFFRAANCEAGDSRSTPPGRGTRGALASAASKSIVDHPSRKSRYKSSSQR